MNNIPFLAKADFPLDATTLQSMQDAYNLAGSALGSLLGGNTIISGCTENGGNVTDGVMCISGEILPFKSSLKNTYVEILETVQKITTENGVYDVLKARYAQCTATNTGVRFADFKRIDLQKILEIDDCIRKQQPISGYKYMNVTGNYAGNSGGSLLVSYDELRFLTIRGLLYLRGGTGGTWVKLDYTTGAGSLAIALPSDTSVYFKGIVNDSAGLFEVYFRITKDGSLEYNNPDSVMYSTSKSCYINLVFWNPLKPS